MNRKRKVLLGLLTLLVVQLVVLLAAYEHPRAWAQDMDTDEDGDPYDSNKMLAVTGTCGLGDDVSVLYAIDTERKQLAVYMSYGGADVRFLAARKIFYDFELLYFNDVTPRTHSVGQLKRLFEKSQEERDPRAGTRRRRR